jgi:hypothetical protein
MLNPWALVQGWLKKSLWLLRVERTNPGGASAVSFTFEEIVTILIGSF